jgi:hypothetical protein
MDDYRQEIRRLLCDTEVIEQREQRPKRKWMIFQAEKKNGYLIVIIEN